MKYAEHFFALAREREHIRLRRLAGYDPPWTEDPIFRTWSVTNVFREDDRTTRWFRENIRSKLSGLAVVKATVAFRWFNRISTGERIKDLLLGEWDSREARTRLLHASPVITGAYIVKSPTNKTKLDGVLWCIDEAFKRLPTDVPLWGESLEAAHKTLTQYPFIGPFVGYEIVTDLRWTDVLEHATDTCTWASAGPGCARGLGHVVAGDQNKFDYTSKHDQAAMCAVMRELLAMSQQELYWPWTWPAWELREVEMWACEYWKYIRASRGARLKRKFVSGAQHGSLLST